jgi:hypothetical protein
MKRRAVFISTISVALTGLLTGCVGFGYSGPSILDVLLLPCILSGCFIPPCEVGDALVIVDDASVPMVPDQEITGCFEVSIVRTFSNDAERELIRKAEGLASTVGPSWASPSMSPSVVDANGDPAFLIADAVTTEALSYYAKHVLAFQTSSNRGNARAGLTYTARLLETPEGSMPEGVARGPIVRLELGYSEWYGPLAASGFGAWREVEFNQAGEVVDVRGDGEASTYVS